MTNASGGPITVDLKAVPENWVLDRAYSPDRSAVAISASTTDKI